MEFKILSILGRVGVFLRDYNNLWKSTILNTELQYCFSNSKILLNKIPILGIKGKKYTILSKV